MFFIMLYLYPYNHHHDGFGHICWGTEELAYLRQYQEFQV